MSWKVTRWVTRLAVLVVLGIAGYVGGHSLPAAAGAPYEWSAGASCPGSESQVVVDFGGETGDEFDLYIDDVKQNSDATPFNAGDSVGVSVVADGEYEVVVKYATTETVVFTATVYIACAGPLFRTESHCAIDGPVIDLLVTDNTSVYRYDVLVDDIPVPGYQDLDITNLTQEWMQLTGFSPGNHTVKVAAYDGDSNVGNYSHSLELDDCGIPDDGGAGGTPTTAGGSAGTIVDAGSESGPLLALGASLLAVGGALLVARRRFRHV